MSTTDIPTRPSGFDWADEDEFDLDAWKESFNANTPGSSEAAGTAEEEKYSKIDWREGKPTVAWFHIQGRDALPAYRKMSFYDKGRLISKKRVNYARNWMVSKAEAGIDCRLPAMYASSPLSKVMSANDLEPCEEPVGNTRHAK